MPIAIEADQLTRKFGDFVAVDRLDLQIPGGQVYGFLGPNGCGKSTTIRMLCGLLRPSSGSVNILGLNIPEQAEELKYQTGYMTQFYSLYRDLTVRENLQFIADIYALGRKQKQQRIEQLMTQYWLRDIANQISGSLSGGQRQRLALAAAVIHNPALLLLDEPTSAVDPQSRRDFWESLFELVEQGTTVLVSTHFMDEAERCHQLAILDQGRKVADGAPRQLMADLDASVIEVHCEAIARARALIVGQPAIQGVTQLGLSLRVLVDKTRANPVEWVQGFLTAASLAARVELTAANLEDVFVVVTGGVNREAPR